jgi:hypothetical protein
MNLKHTLILTLLGITLSACNSGGIPQSSLPPADSNKDTQYESPEHFLLGSGVKLKYSQSSEQGNQSNVLSIGLTNGSTQKLSFAQIVYLAGDFMGDPNTQIGGHSEGVNKNNFDVNFKVMTRAPARDYLPGIIKIVNEELQNNSKQIANHEPFDIPDEDNIRFNCVTGGGCNKVTFLTNFGLYMKLASANYDHFGQDAIDSYLAGHSLALNLAKTAKSDNDLKLAYAYEAYADHFLTDLFASGHLRTPRRNIVTWCKYTPETVSSFLTKIMHDQENKNGIYITNRAGKRWKTYGDKELYINDNSDSLKQALLVMQKSIDQLYDVYKGVISTDQAYNQAKQELPNLVVINQDTKNNPPLFKSESGKIYEYTNGKYSELSNCLTSAIKYGYQYL